MRKLTKTTLAATVAWLLMLANPNVSFGQCGTPVLYGVPESIVFIKCGDELPTWPTVTATDLCGAVMVTSRQTKAGTKCGNVFYERYWTATGANGTTIASQTIRYEDDKPPVLIVPEDTIIYCGYAVPEPEVTSYDECCSWNEVILEEVRTDHNECEYTLVRTWTATDGCNNSVQKSQTIEVIDIYAPVIEVTNPDLKDLDLGDEIAKYDCGNPQVLMGDVKVTDCCSKVTIEPYDKLLVQGKCDLFGYYRKWKCGYIATDDAGNTSEFYFYVVQYDTAAPVLHNVPEDLVVECGEDIPALDPYLVTAEDNCTRRYKPQISEESFIDPADSSNQMVVRTWYFADDCGNDVSASQVIVICNFDSTSMDNDTTSMETDTTSMGSDTTSMDSDTSGVGQAGDLVGPATPEPTGGVDSKARAIGGSLVKNMANIRVYPNPTASDVNIEFQVSQNGNVQIQTLDKLGRLIKSESNFYSQGNNFHQIDLSNHPSGVYWVVLVTGDEIQHRRVVKSE
ncbi:MAG: T9SS type A sorting domain-containing protein [Saprospiraceae bacterium]|nr:T9SS type A sorting domain-containing protein [Saprospiraceae bacterium]